MLTDISTNRATEVHQRPTKHSSITYKGLDLYTYISQFSISKRLRSNMLRFTAVESGRDIAMILQGQSQVHVAQQFKVLHE